jgi:hypothetical protein
MPRGERLPAWRNPLQLPCCNRITLVSAPSRLRASLAVSRPQLRCRALMLVNGRLPGWLGARTSQVAVSKDQQLVVCGLRR